MSLSPTRVLATLLLILTPVTAIAEITIEDAYARASRPNAPTGAAFMTITNTGNTADRLLAAQSDIAKRVELHTHIEDGDGIMRMIKVEDGFEIPAGESYSLKRGGAHVMFMGLTESLEHGDAFTVTLTFEEAGDMTVEIPVDLERKPDHSAHSH